jgi:16S rRNA G966 N2-methylase RsmD
MKESYIGDINDFYKYDLIEKLTNNSKKCLVVWMLTEGDGSKLEYLENIKYKNYNGNLFTDLEKIILQNTRNLINIKKIKALKKCTFIDNVLTKKNRDSYFENVYKNAQNVDIVFFDPDNGITPNNKNKEIKYVYWDELNKIWNMNKNILIYQSYRHEKHEEFIQKIINECKNNLLGSNVLCFKTNQVLFFYITKLKENDSVKIVKEWEDIEK